MTISSHWQFRCALSPGGYAGCSRPLERQAFDAQGGQSIMFNMFNSWVMKHFAHGR